MLVGAEKMGPYTLGRGDHEVPDAYWAVATTSSAVQRWAAPGSVIEILDGAGPGQAPRDPAPSVKSERPPLAEAVVAVAVAMTPRPPQADAPASTRSLKVAEAVELVEATGDVAALEEWLAEDFRKSVQSAITERLTALGA